MAKANTKTVGGGKSSKGSKGQTKADEKSGKGKGKKRKQRAEFPVTQATDADGNSAVNDDGKITVWPIYAPAEEEGGDPIAYDPTKFQPLKRQQFADDVPFYDYRADVSRQRGNAMLEKADQFQTRADTIRKYGSQKKRKKAQKLARLKKQLADLEAELGDDADTGEEDEDDDGTE